MSLESHDLFSFADAHRSPEPSQESAHSTTEFKDPLLVTSKNQVMYMGEAVQVLSRSFRGSNYYFELEGGRHLNVGPDDEIEVISEKPN